MQQPEQKAFVIFDVFRGQITDQLLKKFKENRIDTVFDPANTTGLFQPLDLTVNGYAKKFCKKKFNDWYMSEVSNQLDTGKQIEEIDIKLQLTKFKSLHAEWLTYLYNHMTKPECKEIILKGWKAAGILKAIGGGVSNLESLDPFSDLDPLLPEVPDEDIAFDVIEEEKRQAFLEERENHDSDDDEDEVYLPEGDNRNIFDIFNSVDEEED